MFKKIVTKAVFRKSVVKAETLIVQAIAKKLLKPKILLHICSTVANTYLKVCKMRRFFCPIHQSVQRLVGDTADKAENVFPVKSHPTI